MTGVAVVDDHPAILEWFTEVVSRAPGLEYVCGERSIEAFDRTIEALRRTAGPLPDALREIAAGHHYVSPALAAYVLKASREPKGPELTEREKEVLALIATGL